MSDPVAVAPSVPTSPPEREQFWRDTIAAFTSSGLSVRDFCRRHGLHEKRFCYGGPEFDADVDLDHAPITSGRAGVRVGEAGSRSQKMRRVHPGPAQKNRRAATRSTNRRPPTGRSARVRRYRLWTRSEG